MSIRLRLSLWYTALLGAILVLFSLVVYLNMSEQAQASMDQSLAETARHFAEALRSGATIPAHDRLSLLTADEFSAPGVFVQVVDAEGRPFAQSSNLRGLSLPSERVALELALAGQPNYVIVTMAGERIRVYSMPVDSGSPMHMRTQGIIQVGTSLRSVDQSLDRLRLLLMGGSVGALLLAGLVGWAVASAALRPIADITQTARAIALSRGIARRLPELRNTDEVGRLTLAFNEMLASLQEAYAAQNRFVADASHELRAPLATIQGNLEFLEKATDMPPAEQAEVLSDVRTEIQRLSRLVADLLTLARADAGQQLSVQHVDLGSVVLDAYRQGAVMAHGVELAMGQIDRVFVAGDADRLKQLVLILLDNALKYTPSGRVSVSVKRKVESALLQVADTGLGISPADLPHIFERFYRADKARRRDEGGTGLGLSIAQWIVQEHGGAIDVESQLNKGSVFSVRLPLAR